MATAIFSVAIYINRKKRARRLEVLRYKRSITETIKAKEELCDVNEKLQAEIKKLIEDKNVELEKQKETDETFRQNIQELEKVRDELHELGKRQKEHFSSLIKEKDSQIEQLYAEKEKYEKLITAVAPSKKYANEPIIKLLKHHARKDFTAMTVEEMKQLKALFVGEEQFIKIEDMVSSNEL